MKDTKTTQPDFIFETKHWEVHLSPDQYYLGRCVVVASRDVGSMSDLNKEEWLDFAFLVKKFEMASKKAFGATMYNWTCLMNNAYQNNPPNPHVHWHVRPRYAKPVNFAGFDFDDKEFGHHYARDTERIVPDEVFSKIVDRFRKNF